MSKPKKIVNVTIKLTLRQLKDLKPLFDEMRRLKDGDETASIVGQPWETGLAYFRLLDVKQAKSVHRAIMRATASERVGKKSKVKR